MSQAQNTNDLSPEAGGTASGGGKYKLKEIIFANRNVKILCQNKNGPCPLISICNALLLAGHVTIHPDYSEISLHSTIEIVADWIVENHHKELRNYQDDPETNASQQQRLSDVISLLPSLQYGLDINIHFDHVSHFEYTRELDCFDAAGVPLYHGWVLDSQDSVTHSVVGSLSYNQIINSFVEYRSLTESLKRRGDQGLAEGAVLTDEQQKLLRDGVIIDTFLTETASQFTYMGLLSLYDTVKEGPLPLPLALSHLTHLALFSHPQGLSVPFSGTIISRLSSRKTTISTS
jgi:hypothetical protein